MTITAQYLAEHFEEVAGRVEAGEAVELTGPGAARLQLSAAKQTAPQQSEGRRRLLEHLATQQRRWTDEEYAAMEAQWEADDREMWAQWDEKWERINASLAGSRSKVA